jgi:PIN domain nuclease of toxin-antitoxin system
MKVLLDTHTLIWALTTPKKLSRRVATIIEDEGNVIFVSAASAWEVATKVRLGKLPEAEVIEGRFLDLIEEAGYFLVAIEPATALRAGRLPAAHGDPFDRMIAAQALDDDMPVLSGDKKMDDFGVRRIW